MIYAVMLFHCFNSFVDPARPHILKSKMDKDDKILVTIKANYTLPEIDDIPQFKHQTGLSVKDCVTLKTVSAGDGGNVSFDGRIPFQCFCQRHKHEYVLIHYGPIVDCKLVAATFRVGDSSMSFLTERNRKFFRFKANLTDVMVNNLKNATFSIELQLGLSSSYALVPTNDRLQHTRLREHYGKLLSTGEHSDISFIVRGQEIKAHKCILAARSEYFSWMFTSGLQENQTNTVIEIDDFDAETFQRALQYLYVGWSPYSNTQPDSPKEYRHSVPLFDSAVQLLALADRYQFKDLFRNCLENVKNRITAENVAKMMKSATNHKSEELQNSCFKILRKMSEKERWEILHGLGDDGVIKQFLSGLE